MTTRLRQILIVQVLALLSTIFQITAQGQVRDLPVGDLSSRVNRELEYDHRNAARPENPNSPTRMEAAGGRKEFLKGLSLIKATPPRYDEAEKAFKNALYDPQMFVQANTGLGYVYTATGHFTEAERIYKLLLSFAPKSDVNHFNLGAVYFYRGDLELARQEAATLRQLKSKLAKRLEKLIDSGK